MKEKSVQEENSTNYTSSKYRTPDGVPSDIIIFTITSEKQDSSFRSLPKRELKVLMIRRKKWPYAGSWALPGGFSNEDETLLAAAKRELKEETQIDGLHIEHLNVYSTPNRDPRGWIISSAYYALVNEGHLEKRKAADDAAEVQLFSVTEVLEKMKKGNPDGDFEENDNTLAFDHNIILQDALERIQEKMLTTDIAREFLPEEFTITELLQIIQTVVPSFDEERSNFVRKVTSTKSRSNLIEEVLDENENPKTTSEFSQRASKLYKFTGNLPKLSIYG